jgi:hypothetical protein
LLLITTLGGLTGALAAQGSIHPLSIEIDESANHHPATGGCAEGFINGAVQNPGATIDWVKDCLPNTDPPSLIDSVATGIKTDRPDKTGASRTGHWYGVRIVDGIGGSDENIFLSGGKENDTSTWTIGPGSVGSSKYDATQAYLASNKQFLFFGMERRGNNGTTAFDFEFNQLPPDPADPLIPNRAVDDVLFTFVLKGSGGSGTATAHIFVWDGTEYVEQPADAGVYTAINQTDTPAAPWGFVNSKGNWTTGKLGRFKFAESAVPLSILPGVNPCGGSAYVQIRTRSSATPNSDLKDTTRIFKFVFGGPVAGQHLAPACSQFSYDGSDSRDSAGGTDLVYTWDFLVPEGVTLSGGGVVPDVQEPNVYHSSQLGGTVDVTMPAGVNTVTIDAMLTVTELDGLCSESTGVSPVKAHRQLPATASKTSADGDALTVTLTGSGPGATSLQWQRYDPAGGEWLDHGPATPSESATLVYSTFESDATPVPVSFPIGTDAYLGKQWTVDIRLHADRTITLDGDGGTLTCTADSPAQPVKKVTGVDP